MNQQIIQDTKRPAKVILERLLAERSGVPYKSIRHRTMTPAEESRVRAALNALNVRIIGSDAIRVIGPEERP